MPWSSRTTLFGVLASQSEAVRGPFGVIIFLCFFIFNESSCNLLYNSEAMSKYNVSDISQYSEQDLLASLSHHHPFVYLDSNDKRSLWSSYSYMAFDLEAEWVQNSEDPDVFDAIDEYLAAITPWEDQIAGPFRGGVFGFCSYDGSVFPKQWFSAFKCVICIEKQTGKKWLVQSELASDLETYFAPPTGPSLVFGEPEYRTSQAAFLSQVARAKHYIREGDIYQANISHLLKIHMQGSDISLYQRLQEANPAPYSAFISMGGKSLFSSSPEQFFSVDNKGNIQTRPIKGTITKGSSYESDQQLQAQLMHSEKDQAELLMIVDLERNDLGRVCEVGSVQVPSLKSLESYAYVHHLVARVTGKLRPDCSSASLFSALFPGGSITGAPKLRAMEVITEIESDPRHIYTGCIGYLSADGAKDFNIAIRTLYRIDQTLYCHVGAGIVADSDPQKEWEETLAKAQGMLSVLSPKSVQMG